MGDIWASYREHTKDDFGWQTPFNLGAGVNTPFQDQGAGYFENQTPGVPLLFFGSDRPGGPGRGTFTKAHLADGSFGLTRSVPELSSPAGDFRPEIRFDRLEVFSFSNRPGSFGGVDLWVATRDTVFSLWSTPMNLGPPVNGAADDLRPHIASDRQTLYFASTRTGGVGQADLYVSSRTKQKP